MPRRFHVIHGPFGSIEKGHESRRAATGSFVHNSGSVLPTGDCEIKAIK